MESLGACSASVAWNERAWSARPLAERGLDLIVLLFLLPAVLVIGSAIAIAIYIDSPGPLLYRSRRVGRDGEPFEMLKFRKMRLNATGGPLTLPGDERFTPIGRFLTATRLDELPQVINVLRGEMRLVGPRPELECFVSEFSQQYEEILTVTPGLTGPAQLLFLNERAMLSGFDAVATYRTRLLPEKVRIDVAYARGHSLSTDLRILVRTALLPVTLAWRGLNSYRVAARGGVAFAMLALLLVLAFALASGNVA